MVRRLTRGVASALVLGVLSVGFVGAAQADDALPTGNGGAASPAVTGPVTGGKGAPVLFATTSFDLASVGYKQSEYFLAGSADAYSPTAPLTTDGKWTVHPSSQQPYQTRVVVNRPIKDRNFNGTVVVEWLNVTGGVDAAPDWLQLHTELIRQGYAWVGVSAQAIGLNALKVEPLGDPARYATLTHPGDSYSYDMFSQAGQAIHDNADLLLGGLKPRRLLAAGHSQSAGRLTTYIDAVHPLAHVYDGYLVHGRVSAAGAALSQAPLPAGPAPAPTLIRDDLDVPVLAFQTETDTGGLQARRPDSPRYRLWEVAGTSHFDIYGLKLGATDQGDQRGATDWFNALLQPTNTPGPAHTCILPVNSGPNTFVLRAAIAALNSWVARGTPPPSTPRLETVSIQPAQYALDASGNVRGGIRTPAVDTPVATLGGLGNSGTASCGLFGTTMPFSTEQLTTLYHDHGGFVAAWTRATRDAAKAGFLRPEDARHLLAAAAQSSVLK